ncbi:MAG: RNA helicase, partial [Burkholderiales bacterium]
MSFASLGLLQPITLAITEAGYTTPTPIQAQAIPLVLQGGDLLAAAQTGT